MSAAAEALSVGDSIGGSNPADNMRWALEVYARADAAGSPEANNYAVASLLTALARVVAAGAWPAADAVSRAVGIVQARVEGPGGGRGGGARSVAAEATKATDNAEVGRQREREAELDGSRDRDGGPGWDDENAMGERNNGKAERAPDAAVWNALLSVCARAGAAREALDALALMRRAGLPLNPFALASALTACRGNGDGGAAGGGSGGGGGGGMVISPIPTPLI